MREVVRYAHSDGQTISRFARRLRKSLTAAKGTSESFMHHLANGRCWPKALVPGSKMNDCVAEITWYWRVNI